MLRKRYFFIQHLAFSLSGIDIKAQKPHQILKRPLLCYIPLILAITQTVPILHYTWIHRRDFLKVADSLSYLFQTVLSNWKMIIFLSKRIKFMKIINEIQSETLRATKQELSIVESGNSNFVVTCICNTFFTVALMAVIVGYMSPIIEAFCKYFIASELSLRLPNKVSYLRIHNEVFGYSLAYALSSISSYHSLSITLAMDYLFAWLTSNIAAQFQIVSLRFQAAAQAKSVILSPRETQKMLSQIKSCIQCHNHTLNLVDHLNDMYGNIFFVKFIFSCMQLCDLAYLLVRHSQSIAEFTFQFLFMWAMITQMILYCYHGQWIQEKSSQVGKQIFSAFEWSKLPISCKKLLLLPIMRSQKTSQVKGVFFVVDLRQFIWVFKKAGSLIAVLKSLDEKRP